MVVPVTRTCRSTGVAIVSELRDDGELIGLRFQITDQLVMDAWRDVAAIRRGEIAVCLEAAEVGLPAALVTVMADDRPRSRIVVRDTRGR